MFLVILGAGGHGSDILALVESVAPSWVERVLLFDEGCPDDRGFKSRGVDVFTTLDAVESEASGPDQICFASGVGSPLARAELVSRASRRGWQSSPPLVHPSVEIPYGCEMSPGAVVMGIVWLSPNTKLGEHTYVGYGAKVGHDSFVGSFSSLFPGCFLGGGVSVGESSMIGANATVLPGVSVEPFASVGAGSVVTRDVAAGTTVKGNPAR